MLGMMAAYFDPIDVSEATLAVDTIREVGPAGHFFGSDHTMRRYETAFHAPLVANWDSHGQWLEKGGVETRERANAVWKQLLREHVPPPLDPAIAEALDAYVARRKAEGGAPMN
jgi:trimethylamine--corrinoid protein Co-methyltransferase